MKVRRAIHKLLFYFKIVNNLCPSYLNELLPLQVSDRTNYSLRTTLNYSLFRSRTEHFKRSFFPSTAKLWNDISLDIRCIKSIGSFKQALFSFFNVSCLNSLYNFAIDRRNALIYIRLRLDTCRPNCYLFKIVRREPPVHLCGFHTQTVRHYFLDCALYSALRTKLLSSATRTFADNYVSITNNISFSVWCTVSVATAKQ